DAFVVDGGPVERARPVLRVGALDGDRDAFGDADGMRVVRLVRVDLGGRSGRSVRDRLEVRITGAARQEEEREKSETLHGNTSRSIVFVKPPASMVSFVVPGVFTRRRR